MFSVSFSALTMLVGSQEGRPACKKPALIILKGFVVVQPCVGSGAVSKLEIIKVIKRGFSLSVLNHEIDWQERL